MTEDFYPQFIFNKFIWHKPGGDLEITFQKGLTILSGHDQSYRTTVFRLLLYSFGNDSGRLDKNLLSESEGVEGEFLVNGEQIRVERPTDKPKGQFTVLDNESRNIFIKREMSKYLLEKLGIPEVILSTTSGNKRYPNPLSFFELSRSFVVDRDYSYSSILNQVLPRSIKESVKIFLGLTSKEIAIAENKKRDLEYESLRIEQRIDAIKTFLNDLNIPTLIEIEERRQKLYSLLEQNDIKEEKIREQISSSANESNNQESNHFDEFKDEHLQKRNILEKLENEKLNLENQINQKQDLKAILEGEINKINRHLVSNHVISSYTFSQCPRCLQEIENEMREREKEGNCMLCNRVFSSDKIEPKSWEKALRDVKQLMKEIDELSNNFVNRIQQIDKETPDIKSRITHLENELNKETENFISPLIEEMSLNRSVRIATEKGLAQLDYDERERNYAISLQETELPDAISSQENIENQLLKLQAEITSPRQAQDIFIQHFRKFVDTVGIINKFTSITWDKTNQLPLINGQDHKNLASGPDLALVVLAFHYALLATSVENPNLKTYHPKLLLIDEPEQQKMGKEKYHKVLELLADLAKKHEDKIQIIIMTSTNDITDELRPFEHKI